MINPHDEESTVRVYNRIKKGLSELNSEVGIIEGVFYRKYRRAFFNGLLF